VRLAKLVTMGAHDIGDFQCWPSRQDDAYNRGSVTGYGRRSNGLVMAQTVLLAR
jgi:hypothetical protein